MAISLVLAAAAIPIGGGAGAATSAPRYDIRGTWDSAAKAGAKYTATFTISSLGRSTGAFSGHGKGGGYTWPLHGRLDGATIVIHSGPYDQLPSYTSVARGTVTAGGSTMTGTFSDSNGTDGTFYGHRISKPADARPDPSAAPKVCVGTAPSACAGVDVALGADPTLDASVPLAFGCDGASASAARARADASAGDACVVDYGLTSSGTDLAKAALARARAEREKITGIVEDYSAQDTLTDQQVREIFQRVHDQTDKLATALQEVFDKIQGTLPPQPSPAEIDRNIDTWFQRLETDTQTQLDGLLSDPPTDTPGAITAGARPRVLLYGTGARRVRSGRRITVKLSPRKRARTALALLRGVGVTRVPVQVRVGAVRAHHHRVTHASRTVSFAVP